MAPEVSLAGLPVELVEKIVVQLEFLDVCNLRLAERELAAKASQGTFKSHFFSKSIHLSNDDLSAFCAVTQRDWMGCALQHLTIFGVRPEDGKAADKKDASELLRSALSSLCKNSGHGHLQSLILDLEEAKDWISTWNTAGNTVDLVAAALESSSLSVEVLNLYGDTPQCALETRRMLPTLHLLNAKQLRSLSIVLSASEPRENEDLGLKLSRRICRFLESTALKHLELRWYDTEEVDEEEESEPKQYRFFDEVARLLFPSLQSVALKGISTDEQTLYSFLSRHGQIRSLTLDEIHLKHGKYDRVFAYIHDSLELDSLYLSNLHEVRLVHFIGRGIGKRCLGGPGPIALKRMGTEARKAIPYKLGRYRTIDSPESNRWMVDRARFYGPPGLTHRHLSKVAYPS